MIRYLITQFQLWKANRLYNQAKDFADYLSKRYNGKVIALYVNPAIKIERDNGAVLIAYYGKYIVFNRAGFLLLRRRGAFNKVVNWTQVKNEAQYVTK